MLRRGVEADPRRVVAVPGAPELLKTLRTHARWRPALATGGWGASARLKLACAGIDAEGLPLATSDDCEARVDIVREAIARAHDAWHVTRFERIVCVGDGTWDAETARQLGYPFVGIFRDGSTLPEGTPCTIHDYTNPEAVLHLLKTCPVPSP